MRRKKPMAKRVKSLKNKLWSLFSEYIRRRDADENGMVKCVSCPAVHHWKDLDCGHYIPKSLGLAIYFEERNNSPQCTACNRFRHGNLTQYALALQAKYGEGILDELDNLRRATRKITEWEYEELIETYKAKLALLGAVGEAA